MAITVLDVKDIIAINDSLNNAVTENYIKSLSGRFFSVSQNNLFIVTPVTNMTVIAFFSFFLTLSKNSPLFIMKLFMVIL